MNGKRICTAKIYFRFKIFYIIYLNHILFPSLTPLKSYSPPYTPTIISIYICLAHTQKKQENNKKIKIETN